MDQGLFGVRKDHSSCKSKIMDEYARFTSQIQCTYVMFNEGVMKKFFGIVLAVLMMSACSGPKPYYKTAKGKKKQKYYNELQFGGKTSNTKRKS
jgi:hypothetical protein